MTITTQHAASSYGMPVILDERGHLMDYAPGIKAVRKKLGIKTEQLAELCGVSRQTLYGWQSGKMPTAAALNVMHDLLTRK